MKVNISDILKNEDTALDVEFNDNLPDLDTVAVDFIFKEPISFKGQFMNIEGILRLDGRLKASYSAKCYRCLEDIERVINVHIKEDFVNAEKSDDIEAYTYEGYNALIDKALIDNIILNLPMKQVCSENCKGFCAGCGKNLNVATCDCKKESINPKFEALKDYFNN